MNFQILEIHFSMQSDFGVYFLSSCRTGYHDQWKLADWHAGSKEPRLRSSITDSWKLRTGRDPKNPLVHLHVKHEPRKGWWLSKPELESRFLDSKPSASPHTWVGYWCPPSSTSSPFHFLNLLLFSGLHIRLSYLTIQFKSTKMPWILTRWQALC